MCINHTDVASLLLLFVLMPSHDRIAVMQGLCRKIMNSKSICLMYMIFCTILVGKKALQIMLLMKHTIGNCVHMYTLARCRVCVAFVSFSGNYLPFSGYFKHCL